MSVVDQSKPAIPVRLSRQAAGVMRVLGHVQRLRMVELLLSGSLPVNAIAKLLRLSQPITSSHLKELRAAGIVQGRRVGRQVHYRVVSPEAGAIVHTLRRMHQARTTFADGEAI